MSTIEQAYDLDHLLTHAARAGKPDLLLALLEDGDFLGRRWARPNGILSLVERLGRDVLPFSIHHEDWVVFMRSAVNITALRRLGRALGSVDILVALYEAGEEDLTRAVLGRVTDPLERVRLDALLHCSLGVDALGESLHRLNELRFPDQPRAEALASSLEVVGREVWLPALEAIEHLSFRLLPWPDLFDDVWLALLAGSLRRTPGDERWLDLCGAVLDRSRLCRVLPDLLVEHCSELPPTFSHRIAPWRELEPDLFWHCAFAVSTSRVEDDASTAMLCEGIGSREPHWDLELLQRARGFLFDRSEPLFPDGLPDCLHLPATVFSYEARPCPDRLALAEAALESEPDRARMLAWRVRLIAGLPEAELASRIGALMHEAWSRGFAFSIESTRYYLTAVSRWDVRRVLAEVRLIARHAWLDGQDWLTLASSVNPDPVVEAILEAAEEIARLTIADIAQSLALSVDIRAACLIRHMALTGRADLFHQIQTRLLPGERTDIAERAVPVLVEANSEPEAASLVSLLDDDETRLYWQLRLASADPARTDPGALYTTFAIGPRLRDEYEALVFSLESEQAPEGVPIRDDRRYKQALVDSEHIRAVSQPAPRDARRPRLDPEHLAAGDDDWFLDSCSELARQSGLNDPEWEAREIRVALRHLPNFDPSSSEKLVAAFEVLVLRYAALSSGRRGWISRLGRAIVWLGTDRAAHAPILVSIVGACLERYGGLASMSQWPICGTDAAREMAERFLIEPGERLEAFSHRDDLDINGVLTGFYALVGGDPDRAFTWLRPHEARVGSVLCWRLRERWGEPSVRGLPPRPGHAGWDPFSAQHWAWLRSLREGDGPSLRTLAQWVSESLDEKDPEVAETALCVLMNPLMARASPDERQQTWSWLGRDRARTARLSPSGREAVAGRRSLLDRWEGVQHDLASASWWSSVGPQRATGTALLFLGACLFLVDSSLDGVAPVDLMPMLSNTISFEQVLLSVAMLFPLNGWMFLATMGSCAHSGRAIRKRWRWLFLAWSILPLTGWFSFPAWHYLRGAEPVWFCRDPPRGVSPLAHPARLLAVGYRPRPKLTGALLVLNQVVLLILFMWVGIPGRNRELDLGWVYGFSAYGHISGFAIAAWFSMRTREKQLSLPRSIRNLQWLGAFLFLVPHVAALFVSVFLVMLPVLIRELAESSMELAVARRGEGAQLPAWLVFEKAFREDRARASGFSMKYFMRARKRGFDHRSVPTRMRILIRIQLFFLFFQLLLVGRVGYVMALGSERGMALFHHIAGNTFGVAGIVTLLLSVAVIFRAAVPARARWGWFADAGPLLLGVSVGWIVTVATLTAGLLADADYADRVSAAVIGFVVSTLVLITALTAVGATTRRDMLFNFADMGLNLLLFASAVLVSAFWLETWPWIAILLASITSTLVLGFDHLEEIRDELRGRVPAFLVILPLGGLLLPLMRADLVSEEPTDRWGRPSQV